MRKKFLINIVFLVTLNLLVKPFWIFGIDRTIQNVVGSEAYGLYFALFNFSFLFHSILDAGITNYNNHSVAKNHDFLKEHFSRLAGLKLLLGAGYLLVTLLASLVLNIDTFGIHLLFVLTLNQFLLSFVLFLRSNISGLQIFWLDSLLSVLDRSILIAICSVLLWTNIAGTTFQIEWLAYSQFASYLVTLMVCLAVVYFKTKSVFKFPSVPFVKSTFKKSLPFAVIILFMSMYFRLDAVMIKELLPDGEYQAGLYAQGYRFLDMLNNFVFLFTGILFPLLSKEIAQKTSVKKLINFSSELLLLPAVFVIGVGILFSSPIMETAYTDAHDSSEKVFQILMLSYIPLVFSSIYGTVITAGGSLKPMLWYSGLAFTLNIVLNLVLIPKLGITGAAWASFAAQTIMAISCYFRASQQFNSGLTPSTVLRFLICLTVAVLVFYLNAHQQNQWIKIIILLILSTIHPMWFFITSFKEFKLLKLSGTSA